MSRKDLTDDDLLVRSLADRVTAPRLRLDPRSIVYASVRWGKTLATQDAASFASMSLIPAFNQTGLSLVDQFW
jgi:hypothetical protein